MFVILGRNGNKIRIIDTEDNVTEEFTLEQVTQMKECGVSLEGEIPEGIFSNKYSSFIEEINLDQEVIYEARPNKFLQVYKNDLRYMDKINSNMIIFAQKMYKLARVPLQIIEEDGDLILEYFSIKENKRSKVSFLLTIYNTIYNFPKDFGEPFNIESRITPGVCKLPGTLPFAVNEEKDIYLYTMYDKVYKLNKQALYEYLINNEYNKRMRLLGETGTLLVHKDTLIKLEGEFRTINLKLPRGIKGVIEVALEPRHTNIRRIIGFDLRYNNVFTDKFLKDSIFPWRSSYIALKQDINSVDELFQVIKKVEKFDICIYLSDSDIKKYYRELILFSFLLDNIVDESGTSLSLRGECTLYNRDIIEWLSYIESNYLEHPKYKSINNIYKKVAWVLHKYNPILLESFNEKYNLK